MIGIYVRVSTQDQVKNGYSIEEQINILINYCENNKLGDYKMYIDKGMSASTMNRNNFKKLLLDIELKEISTVLVYRLDRISRSSKDTEYLMNYFNTNNCNFISINESFKYNTASGNNQMRIISANNQLDSELASERTKIRLLGAAKVGNVGGAPIYGYYKKEKKFVINENQAVIIELIFNLYVSGKLVREIKELINYQFGVGFTCERVRRTLINEKYIGNNVTRYGIFKNTIPSIIEEKTFDKVKYIMKNKSKYNNEYSYIFSDLLFCNDCKNRLSKTSTTKKIKNSIKRYYFYYCNFCKSKYINQDTILETNKKIINKINTYYEFFIKINDEKNKLIKEVYKILKIKLSSIQKSIDKLLKLHLENVIEEVDFKNQYIFLKGVEKEFVSNINKLHIEVEKVYNNENNKLLYLSNKKIIKVKYPFIKNFDLFNIINNTVNIIYIDACLIRIKKIECKKANNKNNHTIFN